MGQWAIVNGESLGVYTIEEGFIMGIVFEDFTIHYSLIHTFTIHHSLCQFPLIQLHCIFQSEINSIAYQCMANRYFQQAWNVL